MEEIITKKNVTGQVVEYLKNQITSGNWLPGDRIDSENTLVKKLGVSRVSVRNAIQQLIAVGTLQSRQGKGTFVVGVPHDAVMLNFATDTDLVELLQLRRILETGVCMQAGAKLKPENLKNLRRYLEGMIASQGVDSEEFIRNDIAFHDEILSVIDNRLIKESLSQIRSQVEEVQQVFATKGGNEQAVRFHTRIVEAYEAGDYAAAARAMDWHIGNLESIAQKNRSL